MLACREDFEDSGVSLQVLRDLKTTWQKNLSRGQGARYPWDEGLDSNNASQQQQLQQQSTPTFPQNSSSSSIDNKSNILSPTAGQVAAARAARQIQQQFATGAGTPSNHGGGMGTPGSGSKAFSPSSGVDQTVAGLMNLAGSAATSGAHQPAPLKQETLDDILPKSEDEDEDGDLDNGNSLTNTPKKRRKSTHHDEDDPDAINSDLDDSDELGSDVDADGEDDGDAIMLCVYDKVQRTKNKWKCVMKDGIVNVNGREYVFSKANGEYEW